MKPSVDELAVFCKKKGIVFPTAEIYGGLQGFYDYGPVGVELKNNLKRLFWQDFVTQNEFIVGIDGSLITHPKVWVASEHVNKFHDLMARCSKCSTPSRADTLVEDVTGLNVEGKSVNEIIQAMVDAKVKCPKCGTLLTDASEFRLMFETNIGPEKTDKSIGYLRPETAQLIFADFKTVFQTSRVKFPFGIAQIGKAFRNEISPRNFLFRLREFEQFEIEFFANPKKLNDCPLYNGIKSQSVNLAADNKEGFTKAKVDELLKKGIFASQWHAYWVTAYFNWFIKYGVDENDLRLQPHNKEQLAHYAKACVDIEYKFPFGWKELHGDADRGQFDLTQHQKVSGEKMEIFDEASGEKFVPYVAAEPSQGIERAMLVFLFNAYNDDKERGNIVLKLHPALAPIKVAVFPLVKKNGLDEKASKVNEILKVCFNSFYDESGSIGRRYARQDELGTPFCVTIDYDTMNDDTVTVRDRNTTNQVRVPTKELAGRIAEYISKGFK